MPDEMAEVEYAALIKITNLLKDSILRHEFYYKKDDAKEAEIWKQMKEEKERILNSKYEEVFMKVNRSNQRALENTKQKGASNWLTTLPLSWLGYVLNKQEFRGSIALRYNLADRQHPKALRMWIPSDINHCLTCKLGGYVIMRHNPVRDTIANVTKEVCHDLQLEPQLTAIKDEEKSLSQHSSTADNARLDVSAGGVWALFDRTFIDIRVTHPNCRSHRNKTLKQIYEMKNTKWNRKENIMEEFWMWKKVIFHLLFF